MTTQNPCALVPVVSVVNNHVTALSTDVAKFFGKEHFNVVRDIENLLKNLPISRAFNFEASMVQIASNLKNAPAKLIKAYRMTRDGFTLLVMGWTGKEALQYKLLWLDKFNEMERQLYHCPTLNQLETLTPAQQHQIQTAVAARAQKTAHNYQTIYRALKNRFQVARYDQIPQSKFQDALKFIQCVDLAVPDSCSSRASTGQIFYYDARVLTEHELRALANLIYLRELGKPTFAQVYKGLRDLNSELAPRFYSLIAEGDFPAAALKNVLSRNQMDFTRPIR